MGQEALCQAMSIDPALAMTLITWVNAHTQPIYHKGAIHEPSKSPRHRH